MGRLQAEGLAEDGFQGGDSEAFLSDGSCLGDSMRGERATLGKSLLDVQRELRIRASYVAAIENCDFSAFDAPSFVAGYVRSYARYLNMDPDWTFRRFCIESGFQPTHGMAPSASGPKPGRRPSDPAEALANPRAMFIPQKKSFWSDIEPRAIGSILVLAALVCGLAYGGWTVLQEVQRVTLTPAEDAPAVVTVLDPVENAAISGQISEADESRTLAQDLPRPEALDRVYRPQVLEAPVLNARDGPIAAIDPELPDSFDLAAEEPASGSPEEPALSTPPVITAVAQAMQFGPQMPTGQTSVQTVAPDAPEVQILAARPAWVRVKSADGTVLLEKIMDAGERFTLPKLESAPVLRAGNSGAVYFAVNGKTYGPVAPGAQVVKNVELSSANLTAQYELADLSADPELAEMIAVAQASPELVPQGPQIDQ